MSIVVKTIYFLFHENRYTRHLDMWKLPGAVQRGGATDRTQENLLQIEIYLQMPFAQR